MKFSFLLIIFLINMVGFAQKNTINDLDNIEHYSNEFLLKGKKGKMFILGSCDTLNYAVVHWKNGYFATGKIVNGVATGNWFVYDQNNKLRESLIFGLDAKCILYSKKMNGKGKVVSELKILTPCF